MADTIVSVSTATAQWSRLLAGMDRGEFEIHGDFDDPVPEFKEYT